MEGRDEKGRFTAGNQASLNLDNASKYKEEYCDLIVSWFSKMIEDGEIPTLEDFAVDVLDITPLTLDHWAEKFPLFKVAKEKALAKQRSLLVKGGLSEKLNPSFTKFVLSACHGMREKTETDSSITLNIAMNREIDEESN